MHDEMQSIQGAVVPRCFGMLVADIPYGTKIIQRARDDIIDRERVYDDTSKLEKYYYKKELGAFVENPTNSGSLTLLDHIMCDVVATRATRSRISGTAPGRLWIRP